MREEEQQGRQTQYGEQKQPLRPTTRTLDAVTLHLWGNTDELHASSTMR